MKRNKYEKLDLGVLIITLLANGYFIYFFLNKIIN